MKLFKPVLQFRSFQIFILICIDQITKLLFRGRDFFVGPLHVHSVKNFGLAFSLNFGTLMNILLIAIGLILFSYYFFTHRDELHQRGSVILVLIFAGAISNIIDRLYLGFVRDFLDLGLGFTFNLADVFVAVGIIFIFLYESKSRSPLELN